LGQRYALALFAFIPYISTPSSLVSAAANGSSQYFIAPVSLIHSRGKDLAIPLSAGDIGPYAQKLKGWLREIIYGDVQHAWGVVVEEKSF